MIPSYSILIVDDDREDQLMLDEYFGDIQAQHHVKYFDNGQKALDYLDQVEHDALLPRLMVLDLNMPILNGTQTLLHLKRTQRYKHIPVIIYSTAQNDAERRKCLSLGADDYVVKPITWNDGQRIVARFASYIID